MKKSKTLNKILPDQVVVEKQGKYFINGFQLNEEQLDHYAAEAEVFKKSLLYTFWQSKIRTEAIETVIKTAKDFSDIQNARALLYSLDKLDLIMRDLIEQQSKIVKK